MNIRAVLFDLDGTLVDSLEDLTDAVNHIRGAFSYEPLTAAMVRPKIGKGARHLVRQALPGITDADINRALGMFINFNREHIVDKSRLYPGIADMLHTLAAHDIRMTVISNKNEELSRLIVEALGIRGLFARICGGDTYPERKPSPLPLLNEVEKLGVTRHECVMVGDSGNDIQAGIQASITAIACTWGYGTAEELEGANVFAHTPQELLAAITAGRDAHP